MQACIGRRDLSPFCLRDSQAHTRISLCKQKFAVLLPWKVKCVPNITPSSCLRLYTLRCCTHDENARYSERLSWSLGSAVYGGARVLRLPIHR